MDPYTETAAQQPLKKAYGRAIVLASHDRYGEALSLLEEAIRDFGDSPDWWLCYAYRSVAEAAAMIGQTDKGLATAHKALDMFAVIAADQHPSMLQREQAHTYSILALNHFLRGERRATYEALDKCRVAGFFYRPMESYQGVSMIYTPDVLRAMGDCGIDVEYGLAEAGRGAGSQVRTYPDGSVQIDGPGSRQFHVGLFGFLQHMERVLRGGDAFRLYTRRRLFIAGVGGPLVEGRLFVINAWCEWMGKLRAEVDFLVRLWPFADSAAVDRQRMPVTILFKRRLSHEARTQLVKILVEWADSVRVGGVFSEGPMQFAEPTISFYTKAAQFSINAAASGPHTVLWLVLSLLSFNSVAIMTEVCFVPPDEDSSKHFGIHGPPDVLLPLGE